MRKKLLEHAAARAGSVPGRAEDIPDEYVVLIQAMILMVGAWHATRAAGRPAARFRYPGPTFLITGAWPECYERFCLNAEAMELARLLPRDATPFMVYVALCESGYPPEACTMDDLMRPQSVGVS
jgi:hypothetical protein